jgi:serine/threonine protein kinase
MQNQPPANPSLVLTSRELLMREMAPEQVAQAGATPRWGEAPLRGQPLGHYTLIRQIGQGGYASIYLGVHRYLNTYVALKLVNHVLASDEDVKRFQLEARILAMLRHKHIVRVFDFGVARSTPYLVLEYAPGGDLQQHFPQGRVHHIHALLPIVMQVANGLQYVHNHGLIHCDVKPENMLLGPKGQVWLCDFGIAVSASSVRKKQFKRHELHGSAYYMAPEQINENPGLSSDQYALAAVVYQWLCGQPLFEGTALQICLHHLSTPPARLRDRVASISPHVERVVLKALSKDPSQRFAHIQEFAYALKQASLHEAPSHNIF